MDEELEEFERRLMSANEDFWKVVEKQTDCSKNFIMNVLRPLYPSQTERAASYLAGLISRAHPDAEYSSSQWLILVKILMSIIWNEYHLEYKIVPMTRPLMADEIELESRKN